MVRNRALWIFVLLASMLMASPQTSAESLDDIYAAARQEGTVVWYTTFPLDEAVPIGQVFEKRYPGIKVEIVRASGTALAERFETEYRAGKNMADVIGLALLDPYPGYKERGWLVEWVPPESVHYDEAYKDEGYWYIEGITASCMLYNPMWVKPNEVPSEPTDLLNPQWKGRVGTLPAWSTATAAEFAYYVEYILGEVEYARKLNELEPRLQTAQAKLVEEVIRGEIDIAFPIADYNLYRFKREGAPVECAYPATGAPVNLRVLAIPKDAPNPNAAKLFLNWRLSEEGQKVMQRGFGMRSVRRGIEPIDGLIATEELNLIIMDPVAMQETREDILNRWRSVFGN